VADKYNTEKVVITNSGGVCKLVAGGTTVWEKDQYCGDILGTGYTQWLVDAALEVAAEVSDFNINNSPQLLHLSGSAPAEIPMPPQELEWEWSSDNCQWECRACLNEEFCWWDAENAALLIDPLPERVDPLEHQKINTEGPTQEKCYLYDPNNVTVWEYDPPIITEAELETELDAQEVDLEAAVADYNGSRKELIAGKNGPVEKPDISNPPCHWGDEVKVRNLEWDPDICDWTAQPSCPFLEYCYYDYSGGGLENSKKRHYPTVIELQESGDEITLAGPHEELGSWTDPRLSIAVMPWRDAYWFWGDYGSYIGFRWLAIDLWGAIVTLNQVESERYIHDYFDAVAGGAGEPVAPPDFLPQTSAEVLTDMRTWADNPWTPLQVISTEVAKLLFNWNGCQWECAAAFALPVCHVNTDLDPPEFVTDATTYPGGNVRLYDPWTQEQIVDVQMPTEVMPPPELQDVLNQVYATVDDQLNTWNNAKEQIRKGACCDEGNEGRPEPDAAAPPLPAPGLQQAVVSAPGGDGSTWDPFNCQSCYPIVCPDRTACYVTSADEKGEAVNVVDTGTSCELTVVDLDSLQTIVLYKKEYGDCLTEFQNKLWIEEFNNGLDQAIANYVPGPSGYPYFTDGACTCDMEIEFGLSRLIVQEPSATTDPKAGLTETIVIKKIGPASVSVSGELEYIDGLATSNDQFIGGSADAECVYDNNGDSFLRRNAFDVPPDYEVTQNTSFTIPADEGEVTINAFRLWNEAIEYNSNCWCITGDPKLLRKGDDQYKNLKFKYICSDIDEVGIDEDFTIKINNPSSDDPDCTVTAGAPMTVSIVNSSSSFLHTDGGDATSHWKQTVKKNREKKEREKNSGTGRVPPVDFGSVESSTSDEFGPIMFLNSENIKQDGSRPDKNKADFYKTT